MSYVCFNTFTDSPVSHGGNAGEEWIVVVWENKQRAQRYAYELASKYQSERQRTPENAIKFSWGVREATPDERLIAAKHGIRGEEWEDIFYKGSSVTRGINHEMPVQLGRPEGWRPEDN